MRSQTIFTGMLVLSGVSVFGQVANFTNSFQATSNNYTGNVPATTRVYDLHTYGAGKHAEAHGNGLYTPGLSVTNTTVQYGEAPFLMNRLPFSTQWYKEFTINMSNVEGSTHTAFPVLINITDAVLKTTANGGKVFNASGHDIIFATNASGTDRLKWDIEKYEPATGKLTVWVKVDLNATTGTSFFMCYGDNSITTYQGNRAQVWSSSYNAVYHLADNADATGRGNTLTFNGTSTTSFIGDGRSFNGSSNFMNLGNTSDIGIAGDVTFSTWINPTNYSDFRMLFAKTNGGQPNPYNWYLTASSGTPQLFRGPGDNNSNVAGTTAPSTGSNQYVVVTVSGNTVTHYLNGNTNGTGNFNSSITGSNGSTDAYAGKRVDGYYFLGNMDEYRISSVPRSADWIKTEYNNQSNPSAFYTIGSEGEITGGGNQSPTANAGSDQTITLPVSSATLNGSGTDPDGTISSYLWTKISGTGSTITTSNAASTTITSMSAGVYVFRLTVTDNLAATATDDVQITVNSASGDSLWTDAGGGNIYNTTLTGKVAIGVTTVPPGYKLAVAGGIIAEKILIKLQTGWPDYVFQPTYKLPTLKEVEQFIKENKHLPGIPSAEEVQKRGLDLGDSHAVLLKKIEELTLYLIEMNSKLEKLAAENEMMKKKLEKIKK